MKRNCYCILMVFFILAACVSKPKGLDLAATATQEATVTTQPTPTWTPEPTPTPEAAYKINADFPKMGFEELARNYDRIAKEFSNVTLEDITSGKLLEYELAYIAENPVFTEEAENSQMYVNTRNATIGTGVPGSVDQTYQICDVFINSDWTYRENPNKRPIKYISYYQFRDEQLFAKLGMDPIKNNIRKKSGQIAPNWPIWMATWAYHNPSGKTTLGHSLVNVFSHAATLDNLKKQGNDFKPIPTYKFQNVKVDEETLKRSNQFVMYQVWLKYPELQADDALIKSWVKTKEMPEELQQKLFLQEWYPFDW